MAHLFTDRERRIAPPARRLVLASIVSALLACGLTVDVASAARAPSTPQHSWLPNVLVWNMCGGVSAPCGNGGSDRPARDLVGYVNNSTYKPMAIMLQEVCGPAINYLYNHLIAMGYKGNMIITNSPSSICAVHGNAVFWLGGCYGGSYNTCSAAAHYPSSMQHGQDADNRGFMCGRAAFPSFTACSTHLTHKSDTIAWNQSDYYKNTLNFYKLITPLTLGGGDFNLEGPQDVMNFVLGGWIDGDSPYWTDTHPSEGKIDFMRQPSTQCRWLEFGWIVDAEHSDHHRLYTYPKAC